MYIFTQISTHEPIGVKIDADCSFIQYVKSPTAGIYQFKWTINVDCFNEV